MRIEEFLDIKKVIDKDGVYGAQCMDLWNFYAVNVLEMQDGSTGATCAKNLIYNYYVMKNMIKIENTPSFVPKLGDVVVWRGGKYGHVGICTGRANLFAFECMEQNWLGKGESGKYWHNYFYMKPLFLRPINQTNIDKFVNYNVEIIATVLNVREKSSIYSRRKNFWELTIDAQNQVLKLNNNVRVNGLVNGCIATVQEEQGDWLRIPSGWISKKWARKL